MISEARIRTDVRKLTLCCAGWLAAGMLTAAGGCAARQGDGPPLFSADSAAAPESAREEKMSENRFEALYARWQEHINDPRVRLSSNPRDYVDCEPFREMTALGQAALPRLIGKIKEGASSGWKESQFFLWRAIKDISGTDLSRGGGIPGQQEIALLYINWWEDQPR